jgi:G3E family GTPase
VVQVIKVDLITGFLGAGKTTFIKHYVNYLSTQGKRIAIIENDYGAINVDRMILQDELKDQADVEMVIGGDADCRIRRFKTKLISMAMLGYDRVIVEPSGVYDVDEFFDILHEEPLNKMYEIGNVIAIVDARLPALSKESDYVLASEVAYAGSIVLSRVQEASSEEIEQTIDHVQAALRKCHSPRQIRKDVVAKDWKDLTDEDYQALTHSEYDLGIFVKKFISENHFNSLFYYNKDYSIEEIKAQITKTFADESCGHVFRIKGFALEGEKWKQINATREETRIEDVVEGQRVIIIIGEELDQKALDQYWEHL